LQLWLRAELLWLQGWLWLQLLLLRRHFWSLR
jgi:hypothetical protein